MAEMFAVGLVALCVLGWLVSRTKSAQTKERTFLYQPPPPAPTETVAARMERRRAELVSELEWELYPEEGKRGRRMRRDDSLALDWTDADFEASLTRMFGTQRWGFYTKLAGVSHRNDDGSRRDVAIAMCRELDSLELVPVESKYSDHALQVRRTDNHAVLGWIEDRTAGELLGQLKRGMQLTVLFRHPNFHPDSGAVVGAVIYVLRLGYAANEEPTKTTIQLADTTVPTEQ